MIKLTKEFYDRESTQTTHEARRKARKYFRDQIKYYLKINNIKQKTIAEKIGLTDQEFHNLLVGYQSSAPGKGINSFEDFKKMVLTHLKLEDI